MTARVPALAAFDARSDRSGAATSRRRRAIVDAAIVTFAERGFEGATTREIAEAVGLKQGHLYYYFAAKQDILFAVVDELHQRFVDGLDEWPSEALGTDELWAVLAGHVKTVCQHRLQVRVAYESVRFLPPERHLAIVDKRDRYEARVAALVRARLDDANAVRAPMVTRAILGVVNWVYQWYSGTGPLDAEQVAKQFADLAVALLADQNRANTTTIEQ
jgi:AcrR family transcriptional regulator